MLKLNIENGLCKISENETIEIKEAGNGIPKSLFETYSAFCNTQGGYIILGLKERSFDTYEIKGCKDPDKMVKSLFDTLNNHQKTNRNVLNSDDITVDENNLIIIHVPTLSPSFKPIYLNGNLSQTYKRQGEGDYLCTDEEISAMLRDATGKSQDMTVYDKYDYKEVIDGQSFMEYRKTFRLYRGQHVFNSLSDEDFMIKLGIITRDKIPTLAGILMFGNTDVIREVLPTFALEYIDLGDDNTSERWRDRIVWDGTWGEGNIYNFFTTVINKIYSLVPNRFELADDNLTALDNSDLKIALREAFVNMLIHADYRLDRRLQIKYQNRRFYFTNPGSLRISLEDFFNGKISEPRNQTIALIFRMIGYAEIAGSGVSAILKAVKAHHLEHPQVINALANSLKII